MSVDFHPLRVLEVSPLTEDSIAVTFDVPEHLSEVFHYLPGQHVTVRRDRWRGCAAFLFDLLQRSRRQAQSGDQAFAGRRLLGVGHRRAESR